MAGVYKVASPQIHYKDVFDARRLYLLLRDFMDEEGYTDQFHTDAYLETFYQEMRHGGGKKSIRFWWRAATVPGQSEYFRYLLDVDVNLYNLHDVDIVRNNQKVRAQQGEIQIKIEGKLDMDYKHHFEHSSILKPFKKLFEKLIIKKDYEYHYLKVLDDVQKLELEIKTHLNLRNFLSEKRPYSERF